MFRGSAAREAIGELLNRDLGAPRVQLDALTPLECGAVVRHVIPCFFSFR
jgi:hypothetical protein